jgi:hypothetical protein
MLLIVEAGVTATSILLHAQAKRAHCRAWQQRDKDGSKAGGNQPTPI